ncbi:hypothetical protein BV25DRAFT_1392841 [Artomyces pyxidatus]|uniref:Uncharacterized protein n=1 Tax=Artomyces pyxidatus TaxID=48021 RepID=A0ACB8TDL3_9AGAM|nr:hypothetical protein BV25DRAFT_1392841 [Artomyces pyxidatus]
MSHSNAIAASLPPELYNAILDTVPKSELKKTTLALLRALPYSAIPQHHLFTEIRLTHADQVVQLGRRLRGAQYFATLVREFNLDMWKVDADVAINVVRSMPNLTRLSMCIGPNFAPEHLEELFQEPMVGLTFLSLRFRPYVQQATYYQFLKGAYFDSFLVALSKWPTDLTSLSIMQDPLDPSLAPAKQFAQPLVFFRLDSLSSLTASPFLENLANFRIRIPSRQVSRFLYSQPASLPSIDLLDLSTCNITETDVKMMLQQFSGLRHLILDHSSILRGEQLGGEWALFGKSCAMVGIGRAREREKKLKEWIAAQTVREWDPAPQPVAESSTQRAGRKPRRGGRRGVSTATVSLRASPPKKSKPLPGGKAALKARILPPGPTVRSIAMMPSAHVLPSAHQAIREEFERGWSEGLATLTSVRRRLRASCVNGMRMMRFATLDDDEFATTEDAYDGLIEVGVDADELRDLSADMDVGRCPVLCLAGPGEREGYVHADGCGHATGWEVWQDKL